MTSFLTLPALAAITAGAAVGGLTRWLLGVVSKRIVGNAIGGTFVANIAACALIGIVAAAWPAASGSVWWAAFGIGGAGALSTWSTLAGEIVDLARRRSWWAIGYPLLTVVVGLGACGVGYSVI